MLFAPQISIIFVISTSSNPIINTIHAWLRWHRYFSLKFTDKWPGLFRTSSILGIGQNFERPTFNCNICSNSSQAHSQAKIPESAKPLAVKSTRQCNDEVLQWGPVVKKVQRVQSKAPEGAMGPAQGEGNCTQCTCLATGLILAKNLNIMIKPFTGTLWMEPWYLYLAKVGCSKFWPCLITLLPSLRSWLSRGLCDMLKLRLTSKYHNGRKLFTFNRQSSLRLSSFSNVSKKPWASSFISEICLHFQHTIVSMMAQEQQWQRGPLSLQLWQYFTVAF